MTVLEFLRSQKDNPVIRFLTWYCVLVMEQDLNDIAELTICYELNRPAQCSFILKNGWKETVFVSNDGKHYTRAR
jgi:hypothetical protein